MALPYIFATVADPKAVLAKATGGFTRVADSGSAMDGASATVELVYNDAVFTDAEGKERLILALEEMILYIKGANTVWPLAV